MPKSDFTFDSALFVAVVYGPRGGIVATFKGDNPGAARGPAMRRWQQENEKFEARKASGRDTGAPPLWELYRRDRA